MISFRKHLDEKLKATDKMGDWVKDFQDSDAPQFKGKSQKKRQQMAVAAKLDAEREAGMRKEEAEELDEISKDMMRRYFDKADASHKKARKALDKANQAHYGRQATKDKHRSTINKRIKGIGSVLKRDFARTTGQDYITKPSRMDAIMRGDKGHSMTTKRSDQLHKNYKEEVELDEAMTAAHKKLAYDVHKQLKRDQSMSPSAGFKLKADHNMLRSKYGSDWRKKAGINEEAQLDEAAPKMKGDWLKKERERNREHDAAMGRTPTGRKKPVRQMTSTQKSLASMRKEDLDEQTQYDLVESYLLENNIDVDALSVEQLDEIIGKVIGGAFKAGAKAAVGAARLAKKAVVNKQGNIRGTRAAREDKAGDRAEKEAKKREAEYKRRKRIQDAEKRSRDLANKIRNMKSGSTA